MSAAHANNLTNAGLILAAPSSGSGKTTITLGVLRALKNRGVAVRSAKSGPDYIDPGFHSAATGVPCLNLDAWAMTPKRIKALAAGQSPLLIEGAMGLFDGAPPKGKGATADLARILALPVVLIVDSAKQAQSIAPLVQGFATFDAKVKIAGVILNNIGSARHEKMLRDALVPTGVPVLGAISRQPNLAHPSRHLGLVQAAERHDLQDYLEAVAAVMDASVDITALMALMSPLPSSTRPTPIKPPAQRIAVARDTAFGFVYPHLLDGWHAAGASLSFFSPLADEAPGAADLIYLPGGYPELYAARLAGNSNFMNGLRNAAKSTQIYGECGGYMVLGDGLVDAAGHRHQMAGLLRLETSFAARKLHLGYRRLTPVSGLWTRPLLGHEFHYASTLKREGQTLFKATNAEGDTLPDMGLINGNVCGSFAHMIDSAK